MVPVDVWSMIADTLPFEQRGVLRKVSVATRSLFLQLPIDRMGIMNAERRFVGRGDAFAAHAVAPALLLGKNRKLIVADLRSNRIGPAGAAALGRALAENPPLEALDLRNNTIGDTPGSHGACTIGHALRTNTHLQVLRVGDSGIGDNFVVAICTALSLNSSLRGLDLSRSQISDRGAVAFATVLPHNASLQELHIGYSLVGDAGAHSLADGCTQNDGLRELSLEGCEGIRSAGWLALRLARSRKLSLRIVGKTSALSAATPTDRATAREATSRAAAKGKKRTPPEAKVQASIRRNERNTWLREAQSCPSCGATWPMQSITYNSLATYRSRCKNNAKRCVDMPRYHQVSGVGR
mmetsp:Transcript_65086/g.108132  ORF Transcript_65086/g.108132 Transcript_65086/m.108132 type:complete len:353 (+) Transcript_65086:53-1111(+)